MGTGLPGHREGVDEAAAVLEGTWEHLDRPKPPLLVHYSPWLQGVESD